MGYQRGVRAISAHQNGVVCGDVPTRVYFGFATDSCWLVAIWCVVISANAIAALDGEFVDLFSGGESFAVQVFATSALAGVFS